MDSDFLKYFRRYFGDRKIRILSREEERGHIRRYQEKEDEESRLELIASKIGLILYFAKRYDSSGNHLDDLVSEGMLAAIESIKHFNLEYQSTLSTYMCGNVKKRMLGYLGKNKIEFSFSAGIFGRFSRFFSQPYADGGRFSQNKHLDDVLDEMLITQNTKQLLRRLYMGRNPYGSEFIDGRLSKFYCPAVSPAVQEEELCKKEDIGKLMESMAKLGERERKILEIYFGLNGCEQNFEQIAFRMNLSRQRVQQIAAKGMREIKMVLFQKGVNLFSDEESLD